MAEEGGPDGGLGLLMGCHTVSLTVDDILVPPPGYERGYGGGPNMGPGLCSPDFESDGDVPA